MGFGVVQEDLKQRMKDAGVTYRDLSKEFNKSYHTNYGYLNGLFQLPDEVKNRIEEMIKESNQKRS